MITTRRSLHLPKFGFQRGFDYVFNMRGHDDYNHYYAQDPIYHLKWRIFKHSTAPGRKRAQVEEMLVGLFHG